MPPQDEVVGVAGHEFVGFATKPPNVNFAVPDAAQRRSGIRYAAAAMTCFCGLQLLDPRLCRDDKGEVRSLSIELLSRFFLRE